MTSRSQSDQLKRSNIKELELQGVREWMPGNESNLNAEG